MSYPRMKDQAQQLSTHQAPRFEDLNGERDASVTVPPKVKSLRMAHPPSGTGSRTSSLRKRPPRLTLSLRPAGTCALAFR